MRKLLSILLVLALCVGLMPAMTVRAASNEVYVAGTQVYSGSTTYWKSNSTNTGIEAGTDSDYNVMFTPASGGNPATLTLKNFTFSGPGRIYSNAAYVIYTGLSTMNITLIGTNTITQTAGDSVTESYGVYCLGSGTNLSIGGEGSLSIMAGPTQNSYGIYGDYSANISITGGTITAVAGDTDGSWGNSIGIGTYNAGSITISGGTVSAAGGEAPNASFSCGLYTGNSDITISGTANVTATGKAAKAYSYGIVINSNSSGNINISGGAVTASATSTTGTVSALSKAPTLATGITAGGSTNATGSGSVVYDEAENGTYKWFQAPFTGTEYDLYIGGVRITDGNKDGITAAINALNAGSATGSASFDSDSNTLTLNDFTVTSVNCTGGNEYDYHGLYYEGSSALTININGTNSITARDRNGGPSAGICTYAADLSFTGTGKLAVNAGSTTGTGNSIGIFAGKISSSDISVDGPDVEAYGKSTTNGSFYSYGISCDALTVNSGSVKGFGGLSRISYGIDAKSSIAIDGGTIVGTSADLTDSQPDYQESRGISSKSITVEGGTLTAQGGDAPKGNTLGIDIESGGRGITVNAGTVTVTAKSGRAFSYGINSRRDIQINGGNVTVQSGKTSAAGSTYGSYGISFNGSSLKVTVSGGSLTVNSGNSAEDSKGIRNGKLNVTGGDVSVTSGTAVNTSNGVDGCDISGGSVLLRSGDASVTRAVTDSGSTDIDASLTAIASVNFDGSNSEPYISASHDTYRYIYVSLPSYDVTVSAGTGMTLTFGTVSQTGLSGAMTDVVFTANEGYYFPDPYSSAGTTNGVTVTRDSYTQITVSGTPTANTTINLSPATAKTKLPTPAASFALTGDSDMEISGLIDGTTYRVGFPDGGAADFTVSGSKLTLSGIVAGNYSIKSIATGSNANEHFDSDAAEVTVTKATAPTGVGKTDCNTTANDDGTITGVDNTMEYQKSGDSAWTAVTGTSVTGLVPGTYSVRIAAAGMALASDAVSVTIAEYTAPKADTPVFTPGSQSFTDSIDVTITCALNGAIVYYTDDGSTPSATNGTVTTGAAITLDATKTLKAIAVMTGYDDSDVATATYTKTTPSSGGGSTPAPETYAVTPGSAENGKITVSPENAAEGDKVTVTVTPDEGYELDSLTVKDKDGNEIKVKDNGDGTFTIEMPASEIEVEATFKEAEETPGTDDDFPFVDVPEDAYYRKPVEWAVEKGVTNGVSEDEYGPELSCTRAQVVTFLWITCGSEDAGSETGFDDVDVDEYYDKAVAWAVEQGITAGTSENEFSPEMTITRAQFVTMLWAAKGKPEPDGEMPFKDVPEDAYYAKAVAWAYANDITAGKSADSFAPDDPCTRGQIMTLLYNAYGE